jgi:NAD(P)-dependent dehydrogenase (short-subunit alcohol dehydrogenase family)
MDTGLSSSIVLVTGASKGMGLACAAAFAREGAIVVGVSRSLANLREAQLQLANEGLDLAIYEADLTSDAVAKELIERIEREVGPVDVLVNSAGAARRTPQDELGHDAFQAALDA